MALTDADGAVLRLNPAMLDFLGQHGVGAESDAPPGVAGLLMRDAPEPEALAYCARPSRARLSPRIWMRRAGGCSRFRRVRCPTGECSGA